MRAHSEAMHTHDARGRMVASNEWDPQPPPLFVLHRAADGAFCRVRADMPDALAQRLEALAREEPSGFADAPAVHAARYEMAIAESMGDVAPSGGPVFAFPASIPAPMLPVKALHEGEARLLGDDLVAWRPDLPHRQPFFVALAGDIAGAVCASVRITPILHAAGVETARTQRRKGLGRAAVAAWARAVDALGAEPTYSTSWDNVASRGVAASLGLIQVGADFSIRQRG